MSGLKLSEILGIHVRLREHPSHFRCLTVNDSAVNVSAVTTEQEIHVFIHSTQYYITLCTTSSTLCYTGNSEEC